MLCSLVKLKYKNNHSNGSVSMNIGEEEGSSSFLSLLSAGYEAGPISRRWSVGVPRERPGTSDGQVCRELRELPLWACS